MSVTMEDVARAAGVSRALVSLTYRGVGRVSEQTRQRILAVGSQLGYRPNMVAARLASRAANTIGVVLLDLHNDLYADVYDGLRSVVDATGKHIVLAVSRADGSGDQQALETLLQSRVDVVIAAGLLIPDRAVHRVAESVPIVSVGRDIPGVDSLFSNDFLGAELATRHLQDLGHRDIAFLANPQTDGYRGRLQGYEVTMRSAGLAPRAIPTAHSRTQAAEDVSVLLDDASPPTAVFAHNDQAALGVLDAMAVRGLTSDDVSVVGYDNSSVSSAPGTALTTIDVHATQVGRAAAEVALARLAAPGAERTVRSWEPSLVVRTTTRPHRPSSD
ncbi:LacI family DNA-binding transcriptional regulator [Kineococcus rhizosphaerae]|uniref:LacI family DNA-binding transcriptional regulator n=1 Tax=Kineococcus rhizosphaerae TaxID=559628 RepID=UPI001B806914|nr:LacI family DNA-binding transcriptional regulator [Kineococcus rhizosphaerae]